MDNWLYRTETLIGKENIEKLKKSKAAVFGIGGVGSFALEALARCGIENFILIDNDVVDTTNINRQLIADTSTIGMLKVEVGKNRVLKINPNANVEIFPEFYSQDNSDKIIDNKIDYIVDCIDTISSKLYLIEQAKKNNIKIISCMGMGNRLNPTQIEVADIYSTSVCPLAKKIRKELKARNIDSLKVVYSTENPCIDLSNINVIPSISFMPSCAGLIMASEVVKDLINI